MGARSSGDEMKRPSSFVADAETSCLSARLFVERFLYVIDDRKGNVYTETVCGDCGNDCYGEQSCGGGVA